jgi:thiamine biosynthesis lipoprotein
MGTFLRVEIVGLPEDKALPLANQARAVVDRYDILMSTYKVDSELSILNRDGASRCVPVSPETRAMIQLSLEIARETDGAFDAAYASNAGVHSYRFVELGEGCVRFQKKGIRLDLGGIAKGGALEDALAGIRKGGAKGALIDLGGNAGVFGISPSGKVWSFTIAVPKDGDINSPKIDLSGGFISTSSQEERPGHIVDPKSKESVANDLFSVTTITSEGARGDALSTALFVMGFDRAKDYLIAHPKIGGCLMKSSGLATSIEADRFFCRPYAARSEDAVLWNDRWSP